MSWTWLSDTTPKARKAYTCIVCNTRIEVGEVHVARRGIGDYGPETTRMHTECEELTRDWKVDDWECHYPGDVQRPKKRCVACREVGAIHCAHPEDCGNI